MQERALAPWGTVEEVRLNKRSDRKAKEAVDKQDGLKTKDETRTMRAEKKRNSTESKSKLSSSKTGTSVPAASKIYSSGSKMRNSNSINQSSRTSLTGKSSTSSHGTTAKSGATNALKSSDSVLKESDLLKNGIRKFKEATDKNNDVKQRHKETREHGNKEKYGQSSSAARNSSANVRNNISNEKVKPKVQESRNGKAVTQNAEKRPGTSGKSRRGSTATHESFSPTSANRNSDSDNRKAEARLTNSLERNSKTSTSDRSKTSQKSELGRAYGEASANRRSTGSYGYDNGVSLPNKGVEKTGNTTENLVNGYDGLTPGGERVGSGRYSRSNSGSEAENYSDDFSSYGSDFESDENGEGTVTTSNSNEEIEPLRKQVQFQVSEPSPERWRPIPPTTQKPQSNGKKETDENIRAHEILSFIHLDRSKHLALHFEGLQYDNYMAAFGACDRRQRATQTTERVEDECQTEPRLIRELWTQHPAKGIQGPVRGSGVGIVRVVDALALSRFVQSAAAVILEVIEEDLDVSARMNINISFTGSGINGLSVTRVNLPLYHSLPVIDVATAPSKASRIACAFQTQKEEDNGVPECGLGLWDSREPMQPKEFLTCRSPPQRLTWLGDEIVVAALEDSSLAAWDLRRTTSSITPAAGFSNWGGLMVPRRAAAFSSALESKELCRIVGLCSLTTRRGELSDNEEETSIVTLDFEGHLVFWSLFHIQVQETDNALDDLMVAPQSTIKLVCSARIKLSLNNLQFTALSVIDQELFIGRDDGGVFHLNRHATPKFPKAYTARPTGANEVEVPSGAVTCLCGVGRYLVVASSATRDSSTLRIFDRVSAYPLRTVTHWARVSSVLGVSMGLEQTTTSSTALLVNADYQLCRFDLNSTSIELLYENVQSLSIHKATDMNVLLIGRVDGALEVHTLS
ncbi:WD repeat-containing protein 60-like isoform X1 [Varroa jacobsoni]|uniref:WD repeat-containing protein 60-like isoform X1 n=1 Tax=Varroa jacobsoni TaxID=62625 RepID=UPI000BF98216|nr:WD repeat-containing protein 60-like isoform X1 [Varroa jacobsoni]